MLNVDFYGWLENRIIEESTGRLRQMQQNDHSVNLTPDEFARKSAGGTEFWVINNASKFLSMIRMPTDRELMDDPRAMPSIKQHMPPLSEFSLLRITDVDDRGMAKMEIGADPIASVRENPRTHSGGATQRVSISELRDVTDSFKALGITRGGIKHKYFINTSRLKGTGREKANAYMRLTSAQPLSAEDLSAYGAFGGAEMTKKKINQAADEMRKGGWEDLYRDMMDGEDISLKLKQMMVDDVTERNAFENPRFLKMLSARGMNPDDFFAFMKWSGMGGQSLTAQDQELQRGLAQLNHVLGMPPEQRDQIINGNQQVNQMLSNPEAVFAASTAKPPLENVLSYIRSRRQQGNDMQADVDDLWAQRVKAMQQAEMPQHQGEDEDEFDKRLRMMRQGQTQGPNPEASGADEFERLFGKAESFRYNRFWKYDETPVYLTESRRHYRYYPTY